MTEVVVTTGAVRHEKLQSNRYNQHINIQLLTGQMPFMSPSRQFQSTKRSDVCFLLNNIELNQTELKVYFCSTHHVCSVILFVHRVCCWSQLSITVKNWNSSWVMNPIHPLRLHIVAGRSLCLESIRSLCHFFAIHIILPLSAHFGSVSTFKLCMCKANFLNVCLSHGYKLPEHTSSLNDSNFLTRMLYNKLVRLRSP